MPTAAAVVVLATTVPLDGDMANFELSLERRSGRLEPTLTSSVDVPGCRLTMYERVFYIYTHIYNNIRESNELVRLHTS